MSESLAARPIPVLAGRRIILGITGGIAAYKVCSLASQLTRAGALVDVVMTDAACRFVSPMTFQSLTGRAVYNSLWDGPAAGLSIHIPHVGLAHNADLAVIAPATANTLAKLAHGVADNKLTTILLSARCPLLVAPAMDLGMWDHPATQANLDVLIRRGVQVEGPATGRMASGLSGQGRMSEPEAIFDRIRLLLSRSGPLQGRRVLVSAGPTREFADPFRFISNPSTGTQGYALAQAALDLGAEVTLVSGPVALKPPAGARLLPVQSALELHAAMLAESPAADLVLMAAAVADFRPARQAAHKLKRHQEQPPAPGQPAGQATPDSPAFQPDRLDLVENPDILQALGRLRAERGLRQVLAGFAAESQDLEANARRKLDLKGADWIAANPIGAPDAGFGTGSNRIVLLGRDRRIDLGSGDKDQLARALLAELAAPWLPPPVPPAPGLQTAPAKPRPPDRTGQTQAGASHD